MDESRQLGDHWPLAIARDAGTIIGKTLPLGIATWLPPCCAVMRKGVAASRILLFLFASLFPWGSAYADEATCATSENEAPNSIVCESAVGEDSQQAASTMQSLNTRVLESCTLVMAESSIPNSGWGVFTLAPIPEKSPIHQGDIVIHIPDPNPQTAHGMRRLLWEYLWDGQEVYGQYEGQRVMSMPPGIGVLANGQANYNVLPSTPDHAGLDRQSSPGAGAITYYHNFSWYAQKDIATGSELFVNYGPNWFRERGYQDQSTYQARTPDWLRDNGYCLDNLVPGRSTIEHAGRGAFAARDLPEGTTVAPVPVLPVSSDSLQLIKQHESGRIIKSEQLLRNYCFGHQNSSLLLYPYGPMINLINHNAVPNVKLVWSNESILKPMAALQESSKLLLTLVALRPVQAGEEIFLDYGESWTKAWEAHVSSWRPQAAHIPAATLNGIDAIRTASEQQQYPYPANIFTSCYYQLADPERVEPGDNGAVLSYGRWLTPGLMEPNNLRPCMVLDRQPTKDGKYLYTVRAMNRPNLPESERIPQGERRIVAGVPREAIRFSDRMYSTDQHMETAFRKEIGLDDFPSQWMDSR